MKKIIKLTENDLTRIVKRVIKESYLTEININGVEYGYDFKDENQLGQYQSLMSFVRNELKSVPGLDQLYYGIGALHKALSLQSAIDGIRPEEFSLEKAMELANKFDGLTDQEKNAMNTALKNPIWKNWYGKIFIPKLKNAYNTVFPNTQAKPIR